MRLSQYFKLVDIQARMALKADASEYFFGYIWWVLEPLLFVGIFYLVFEFMLGSNRENYVIFLMCGNLPFMWFSKSVTHSAKSVIANVGLIGNIDIPKTMFPLAMVQEGLYKQAIVFLLLICVLVLYGYTPSISWFWLVPVIIVNYIVIVACAFIASVLVCFFRDLSMFIPLAMMFLMFSSGVFFDFRELNSPQMMELMFTYNPMAFLLDAYRQVLMNQTMPDLVQLARVGLFFAVITALMVFWMRKNSRLLALKAITA
jgi:lipopolysaccharide transport system permease protein